MAFSVIVDIYNTGPFGAQTWGSKGGGLSVPQQLSRKFPGKSQSQISQVLASPGTWINYFGGSFFDKSGYTQAQNKALQSQVSSYIVQGAVLYAKEQAERLKQSQAVQPSPQKSELFDVVKADVEASHAAALLAGSDKARLRSAAKATEVHWKAKKWWQYGRREGMLVTGPQGITTKAQAEKSKLGGRYNAPKGKGAQVSSGVAA
jgi:hypothetical protein